LQLFQSMHRKNDFAEKSKILPDIDSKIILLDHQNNFVGILKLMSEAAKNFDILPTNLSILHNLIVQQNYFSKLKF